MNIALVVLDTLRKDAFDEHFAWLPGRRYENAWAPSNWTAPVHAAMFTGKYASEVGVHSKASALDCDEPVLAELLSSAGYTTRAFSANPNVSKRFKYDRGFESFTGSWQLRHYDRSNVYDWSQFARETGRANPVEYLRALWECMKGDVNTLASLKYGIQLKFFPDSIRERNIDDGARTILERIREIDYGDREFMFINLMEAHAPYDPPEAYQRHPNLAKPSSIDAFTGAAEDIDQRTVRESYDDAVRYLSDVYEELFVELHSEFDYVVTLSDHGELLGEHGLWDHQYGLYPELTHVPLVVSGEGLSGSTDNCVSLLDVHRTILDLADVNAPTRGNSLLPEATPRECFTEFHGLTSWLLDELRKRANEEVVETYDTTHHGIALPPSYYGHESKDGWSESGESNVNPQAALGEAQDDLNDRPLEKDDMEISESVKARLEDLGYA